MSGEKRAYVKRARAEGEARTRERIVCAAVAILREGGAGAATVTAVAERAGVRRSTLYRHFSGEAGLASASASRLISDLKVPSFGELEGISYGPERLTSGLSMAYAFYGREAGMIDRAVRDASVARNLEPLRLALAEWRGELRRVILDGLGSGSDLRPAALAHALSFEAWRSLCVDLGLPEEDAVRAMTAMVRAL